MSEKSAQTPLMKQYWEIKSLHTDKILFFRMGDFYELFFEDARTAAPLLGIQLTSRNKKAQDETPMCGFPHHSVAGPLNKLLALGFKVALCDQIEDPKLAKGLVRRAVTRILSPGMVFDPATLDEALPNYIASFRKGTMAFVDVSTEEAFYIDGLEHDDILELHKILGFVELVHDDVAAGFISALVFPKQVLLILQAASDLSAAEVLADYIQSFRPEQTPLELRFQKRNWGGRMEIPAVTYEHLEIFHSDHGRSFFDCVRRTVTPLGTRRLRLFMRFPLREVEEIRARQSEVTRWIRNPLALSEIRKILARVGDLERRFSKISLPQSTGRDLLSLVESVENAQLALSFLGISPLENLVRETEQTLVEDQPLSIKQGNLIRGGISAELDEWIQLATHSEELLLALEQKMRASTGIHSLKIRYSSVFGYAFEITKTHVEKIPVDFVRKQTLANAERYTHPDLLALEEKLLHAQTIRNEMEFTIFAKLRARWLAESVSIAALADQIANLDVFSSFAQFALENRCVAPVFTSEKGVLKIQHSRHPVVEEQLKHRFVPNTIQIARGETILLTGPNMAGKSTLMRQVALTILLAQIGSYVPAAAAELSVIDQIFTRIGAHDKLSAGLSTFMVEMTETADIVHGFTKNSLILLDEIGRGTSTYDGLSLAQALLENFLSSQKGYVFFATHYHELTRLERTFPAMQNHHMAVDEVDGHLDFSYILKRGPAKKSYGIQVARLAGMPGSIIKRATDILKTLEVPPRVRQFDLFEDGP